VAFAAVGHVDHAGVHADASHYGTKRAVDHHAMVSVAQMAVEAVGVSHGNCGYNGIAVQHAAAVIAHGGSRGPFFYGDVSGLQRGNRSKFVLGSVVHGGYTIQADAETHQIILMFGETAYAR